MRLQFRSPAIPAFGLLLLAALVALRNIVALMPDDTGISDFLWPDPDVTAQMLLHYTVLPRIAVAAMAGAGLALSGALLQHILRNPLAEPATLGISAGAYLSLAIVTLWFPSLLITGREWVALPGASIALLSILALAWGKGLSPVTVTLAGMIVSLYCGAVSAVLALFNHDFLVGIFLWGEGNLDQQDWGEVVFLAPRLGLLMVTVIFLVRPLTLLGLEDENARNLGFSIVTFRLIALAISAALIAVVTAAVGVIGFVGLAAPALARATGARRTGEHLMWSTMTGAGLLLVTDQLVMALPTTYRLFPTGALTALVGAPLLFVLIRQLRLVAAPQGRSEPSPRRLAHPAVALSALVLLLIPAFWLALVVGQGPDGWEVIDGQANDHLMTWRGPRALAAFSGGAMLGLAGVIMQRVTGNPMASPEVLGVSSGAMLGVILLILTIAAPTREAQVLAGAAGAFVVLLLMILLSRRPDFAGDRMLLIGITLGSVSGFVMAVFMASQDPRLGQLLAWLSGSTYAVQPGEAWLAFVMLLMALATIPFLRRWLQVLPLGMVAASATGVPIALSRNILFAIAALLTAGATILVGPLSFAGLMGPHLARLAGFQRPAHHLVAASMTGGLVLLVADWLGRNIIFPFQIPAGLLATLVGGPFLLVLIARRT